MREGWTRWGFLELLFSYLHCPSTIFARSPDSIAPEWFETLLARSPKSEECLSVFRFEHELMRNCKDTKMQKQAQIDAFALSWTPFTRQRLDVNAISPHLHLPPLSLPYRTNPSARIACSQWQSLQRAKNIVEKRLSIIRTKSFFPSVQTERKKKSERKKQINFSSNYVYARAGLARERERAGESEREREN